MHIAPGLALAVPAGSLVVLAGLPGAGKTTLLRRLAAAAPAGVVALDAEDVAARLRARPAAYAVLRPLVHAVHLVRVLVALAGPGRCVLTTDPMTALANLRQFDTDLERESAFTIRHRAPLALILVELDNLGVINDALGHSAGDRAVIWTAEGLRGAMRCSDRSFRIGGDQFAVLLRGLDRASGLRAARRFVKAQNKQPLRLDVEEALEVTVSVGVAAADASNDFDVHELFRRARRALSVAKSRPENRVEAEPELPGT